MTHLSLALTPLVLAIAASQAPTPGAAEVREPLRPLAFLVGSCWTGTFPGGSVTDTHCFESVYGGHFIRDRHVVRGAKAPYEGETLYGWDAAKRQLVFTYWNSNGGISTGTVEPGPGGLVFPESHRDQGGTEVAVKTTWTPSGTDGYDVIVTRLNGGEWREAWRMTLRRDSR